MGRARIIPANPSAIFLPFQSRWVEDNKRLKMARKGRQLGFSWATAYAANKRTALRGARYDQRSEEHTSELQSLMRISYAVFCLKKKNNQNKKNNKKINSSHLTIPKHTIKTATQL